MSTPDQEKADLKDNERRNYKIVLWGFAGIQILIFTSTVLLPFAAARDWLGTFVTNETKWLGGWYIPGAVLGYIIIFVTGTYFYDKFIVPYRKEQLTIRSDYPNFIILMGQWFFPVFCLFLFIQLGFFLTIHRDPFRPLDISVFSHPYQYGLIYTEVDGAKDDQVRSTAVNRHRKYFEDVQKDQAPSESAMLIKIYKLPYLIAIAFSFLGTLIYILRDIARRFYTGDLYSKTLVNYIIRMIFAASVSLVIAYFMSNHWWVNEAPLVFFFAGIFPQRALQYIDAQVQKIPGFQKPQEFEVNIPLNRIEGMTEYIEYRFREIGIDDVNSLAFADLKYLRTNLGFTDTLLCDFVSQALLILELTDDYGKLRKLGIRTICNFKEIVNIGNYQELAQKTDVKPEKLKVVMELVEKDIIKSRIEDITTCCKEAALREKAELNTRR